MNTGHRRAQPLLRILIAYLMLNLIYGALTPAFEAPDEEWHYPYVRYLAAERQLPPRDSTSALAHQSSQPPLYYALAAPVAARIAETHNYREVLLQSNPFWYASPAINDNQNRLVQTTHETPPWSGTTLAVHMTRLTSAAFGLLTLVGVWLIAVEVFPHNAWLPTTAVAFTAFNPQFIFVTAAINNDAAGTAFSTLALWLVVRGIRSGFTPANTALSGIAIGLAILSKVSALALLPLAGISLVVNAADASSTKPQERSNLLTQLLLKSLILGFATLITGGWWYLRSAWLYNDPLSIGGHLAADWAHENLAPWLWTLGRLGEVERTFWAAFGWGNLRLPERTYHLFRAITRLALLGLAFSGVRYRRSNRSLVDHATKVKQLLILTLWLGIVIVALIRWMQMLEATLGRLLFPALGSIAILLAIGLRALFPRRHPRWSALLAARMLFVIATLIPGFVLYPAYAPPRRVPPQRIPAAQEANVGFYNEEGDLLARIVGYTLTPDPAQADHRLYAKICWQAVAATPLDYTVFIQVVGPEQATIAQKDTYPGLGHFATSRWKPGDTFCDTYPLNLKADVTAPAIYELHVGLYNLANGNRLKPKHEMRPGSVSSSSFVLTHFKVIPSTWPSPPHQPDKVFGGQIALVDVDVITTTAPIEATLPYTLTWYVLSPPQTDYMIFAHLHPATPEDKTQANMAAGLAAQGDGPPRRGIYPTSWWSPGEIILDHRNLILPDDLAPGHYILSIGLYDLETMQRLLLSDGSSTMTIQLYLPE